jgi:hypothetical protein
VYHTLNISHENVEQRVHLGDLEVKTRAMFKLMQAEFGAHSEIQNFPRFKATGVSS